MFPEPMPSERAALRTLESSGLINTHKSGRVRTCSLNQDRRAVVDDWLAEQRRLWTEQTDRLADFVTEQQENQ